MNLSTVRLPAIIAASVLAVGGAVLAASPSSAYFLDPTTVCTGPTPGGYVVINGTAGNNTIKGTSKDEIIYAGDGKDTVDGGGGDDIICGEGGADTLSGGGGDDILDGGAGNDELRGGTGDDVLLGGGGTDVLRGGTGFDNGFDTGNGTVYDGIEDRDRPNSWICN